MYDVDSHNDAILNKHLKKQDDLDERIEVAINELESVFDDFRKVIINFVSEDTYKLLTNGYISISMEVK